MENKTTGVIQQNEDGFSIRFERQLNHPVEKVWDALTKPAILAEWFAAADVELWVGGKIRLYFPEDAHAKSKIIITRLLPFRLFEYTWDGKVATWELYTTGEDHCLLIFTYSRMDAYWTASAGAGWQIYLEQLEVTLSGSPVQIPEENPAKDLLESQYQSIVDALLAKKL